MQPRPVMFISAVVAVLLLLAAAHSCARLSSGAAWGHESAAWIQANPAYIDAANVHCCGPNHCAVVEPGEIVREGGGWLHVPTKTRLMDGIRGIYASTDAQTWRCVRGQVFVCLFTVSGA